MSHLTNLRINIDQVDNQIVILLLERKNLSIQLIKLKREMKIPIYTPTRDLSFYDTLNSKYSYDYHYLKPIFETINQESRNSK